ncbi:hypothetical protein ABT390_33925 [Streptomyces aurantiacus]|uniref:Uncharacterized protein n=1 Tax=Streptomyces aurantiacus JA 4570 TaxID=1286094 RepID=S3ZUL3_9ACTN|nr:hypothetical protein [Streptomyces aurantiacus]EPH46883.1 hypothetical protein STRAU_0049 [Streptomyces aurantiacus JA 4570]
MHTLRIPAQRQQRSAAALIRAIAHRTPRLRPESVCERSRCFVAWTGEEADCWNCGLPATFRSARRGSALQRLLTAVDAHTLRTRTAPKAVPA